MKLNHLTEDIHMLILNRIENQEKKFLHVKNISKTINGEKILDNISFTVKQDDKIAFLADNENAKNCIISNYSR